MDEGVQARLRTEFATPFEGKKQIQLDFRYSGRDYTTHFEYEQHRLGHTISLSLLNPCLLLQCDLSSGWTLTDLQKDIRCFTPPLPNHYIDVLAVLDGKLSALLPTDTPHKIVDVMTGDDDSSISVNRVLRGGDAYYEKYGYRSPFMDYLKRGIRALAWGDLSPDMQRLFVGTAAAAAAFPSEMPFTEVMKTQPYDKTHIHLAAHPFNQLTRVGKPIDAWIFTLDEDSAEWADWSHRLLFTNVIITEKAVGGRRRTHKRRTLRQRQRQQQRRQQRQSRRSFQAPYDGHHSNSNCRKYRS